MNPKIWFQSNAENSSGKNLLLDSCFKATSFTDAKHSAFSTNHLTDIDKTKHNYNQQHRKT